MSWTIFGLQDALDKLNQHIRQTITPEDLAHKFLWWNIELGFYWHLVIDGGSYEEYYVPYFGDVIELGSSRGP